MSVNLIQDASVTTGSIDIKFAVTIDIDTLINSNFTLLLDGATPSPVSSPFETISVARDYDSISRIIRLYLISALTPETDYILRISNLKTPFNKNMQKYGLTLDDIRRHTTSAQKTQTKEAISDLPERDSLAPFFMTDYNAEQSKWNSLSPHFKER